MKSSTALFSLGLLLLLGGAAHADEASDLLGRAAGIQDLPARIDFLSSEFVGRKYLGGPLGEGPDGRYDRAPLERLDVFDCTTFVETVTALAISRSREDYDVALQRLRYRDGHIDFTLRNHFPSADWVPNNIAAGFYEDLTARVMSPDAPSIATARIDKPSWYAKMMVERIQRNDLDLEQKNELLRELRSEGDAFDASEASLPYVPLTTLFDKNGLPIEEAFARIPSGAVVSIVRPGWDLTGAIGTQMNVSHQGLAVRSGGILYLRHASDAVGEVVSQPFAEYLNRFLSSPTIKGIHLLEVR